ncbi:MAG: conjugative relaxase-like TrwC/TraI family protein [Ilumatobacter sp.]
MLTVGKVGPANAGYYQSAVVGGVEDYYAGDGDAPGRWIGRADLVGAVAGRLATAVDSKLLLESKCAPDGTRLGKTTVTERSVTAFDLTFSAPKSVSVLYALGDDDVVAAVEAAHTAAVEQAVKSVSPRIAYTRTAHAGAAVVDTDGVLGIRYRHRTSRSLDPQLHDHVLISNAVRTVSDGRWRTIDARGLYKNAKAAGVEYQTFLRAELRAFLGVEFGEVDANGQADIVGIDQPVLTEFSTRAVDIERKLDEWTVGFVEREGRVPSPAEVGKAHKTITLATRPAKPDEVGLTTATLRQAWRARADGVVDVDQMLRTTLGKVPSPAVIVRPTIDEVLEAIETRHAEWSESQLIEQIAARTTGPTAAAIADTIEEVRREAMGSRGVVDLCRPTGSGEVVRMSDGRPVGLPPSAVRYATARHLGREVDLIDWATNRAMPGHQPIDVEADAVAGLDESQAAAVVAIVGSVRPVVMVVGPAGAGKTRMLAAAVDVWRRVGIEVFGVGPSASSAQQLADGAGTAADTIHKLVYEHNTKWVDGRELPDPQWALPTGSVVIIDEAGMVDTRLLHIYAQIAKRNCWRTILVGDHRQLDAVDAGGMFAELVEHPGVTTAELDTLHRFEHDWEANASLQLRDRDPAAIAEYERHGRIHGHVDEAAAIVAVADAAFVGIMEGRDVLVMAPTNRVVDEINTTLTQRLLAAGALDPADKIEIAGHCFYAGQPVVTRANDRRLTYGPDREWVRNGDRWTVTAGTQAELYLQHRDTGHRQAIPGDYLEAGNVSVDYASTIHRSQGATVGEAHLLMSERTDAKQLYVGATRGRNANYLHASLPAFDLEQHGPETAPVDWSPADSVAASLHRESGALTALARRRLLRDVGVGGRDQEAPDNTSRAVRRLESLSRRRGSTGRTR